MSERQKDQEYNAGDSSPVSVQILDEDYTAALFVPEEVSAFPSLKQVHLAIENAGIRYGINDGAVENLIQEQTTGRPVVFARGKPPAGGGSYRLVWHENSDAETSTRDITREILENGREMYLFTRVEEGQQILSKLPASEGEAGINVFGESVTLPGTDIPLPAGEGTSFSRDELTLIADKAGIATWTDGKVSVLDIQHIEGSVDSLTGDVKINGSVHIAKDVCSGFRVEALGDIYIGGNVEGADVYSRRGSVIVRNGVLGQGQARILAGKNILAGFIQDATVGAKFNVEAERYIINSAGSAGRYVMAVTSEGLIRGGTVFAEKRIEARTAGSEGRIASQLKVGYTAPQDISRSRYRYRHDQRRNRMELAHTQKRLAFLRLLKERMGQLTADKEEQLADLENQEIILFGQRGDYDAGEAELKNQAGTLEEEKLKAETIRIHDTIYPKVSVAIGDTTLEMDKERHNLIFFRTGDKLAFGPLHQTLAKRA